MSSPYTDVKRKRFSRSKASKTQKRLAIVAILFAVLVTFCAIYTTIKIIKSGDAEQRAKIAPYGSISELAQPEVFKRAYLQVNCNEQVRERISTIRIWGTTQDNEKESSFKLLRKRPYNMHLTVKAAAHSATFGIDEDRVWKRIRSVGKDDVVSLLEGEEANLFLGKQRNFFDPIITAFTSQDATIMGMEATTWDGHSYLKVSVKIEPFGELVDVMVDPQTMLPKAEITEAENTRTKTTVFSDYREIEGVPIPFKSESMLDDGTNKSSTTIKSVAINSGVFPEIFSMPKPLLSD